MNPLRTFLEAIAHDSTPKITWYGPESERIELSGRVLANWVIKTANLLVEELDVGPGSVVMMDMPPHWRTVVLGLGVWVTGGGLTFRSAAPTHTPYSGATVITSNPSAWPQDTLEVVAVSLPALATKHESLGPVGIDYAATVLGMSDDLGWMEESQATDVAFIDNSMTLTFDALRAQYAPPMKTTSGNARVLLQPTTGSDTLLSAFGILLDGGSLVIAPSSIPIADSIIETEQVTQRR